MNKKETFQILRLISSVHGGINLDDLTVEVWRSLLPEPYEMVLKATQECLRNNKYAPKPADIVEQMHKTAVPQITGEDAWKEIHDAYMALYDESDYAYANKIHKSLSTDVQKIVTPQDLIDYAFHMESTKTKNYEKPRIVKAFDSMQETRIKKEIASKPVNQIAEENLKLLENKDGGLSSSV